MLTARRDSVCAIAISLALASCASPEQLTAEQEARAEAHRAFAAHGTQVGGSTDHLSVGGGAGDRQGGPLRLTTVREDSHPGCARFYRKISGRDDSGEANFDRARILAFDDPIGLASPTGFEPVLPP